MSKLGTTRPTTVVNVVTNLDLLAEHEAATRELERLNRVQSAADRLNSAYSKEIREQANIIQNLEAQMDESTVCVKLKALKRAKYAEVVANHPPREDNDVDTAFGVNTDTFGDELLPLSIVDAWNKATGDKVDFTGDDWAEEAEEFTDAQYSEFAMAALNINRGATAIPFSSIASAVIRN